MLPGLPNPVSQQEFDDPGEMELELDITCSTLFTCELPSGLPEDMQDILNRDNELRLAFCNACENHYDEHE